MHGSESWISQKKNERRINAVEMRYRRNTGGGTIPSMNLRDLHWDPDVDRPVRSACSRGEDSEPDTDGGYDTVHALFRSLDVFIQTQ
ncbi:hypothetical protein EVAR_25151_1 [Eumeta japonica]|uniref:Uncharacterized protein n=1 Tax=Eumeta variegata TaxID=151549 RepID=A0A4C1VRJ6_EUMVA|nr:hypothetical protein EVAR_25151_1 [Eumeta japonica]